MANDNVKIKDIQVLSQNKYILKNITFDYLRKNGTWQSQSREAYDHGNAATILLYNKDTKTVLLTRQFRMPAYLNGSDTGMLIETCAGLLEAENPEDGIKRETEEETGYRIERVKKIFEAYMSPGSVTEKLFFYTGEYNKDMKVTEGGGTDETEELEILEIPFTKAFNMINTGEIQDAKTIMLLQYAQINSLL